MKFKPTVTIYAHPSDKEQIKTNLEQSLKETKIPYELSEENITLTEYKVTFNITTLAVIKHLFKLVGAPEEEIKYLCKVASVIERTAKDVLNSLVQNVVNRVAQLNNNNKRNK